MAIFVAHLQKNFKLTVEDGLPNAPVELGRYCTLGEVLPIMWQRPSGSEYG